MTDIAAYTPYIDWDRDGTYTSEQARVLAFTVRRGRTSTITDEGYTHVSPGYFSVTLENYDGRYQPYDTDGPLYGYLKPNREFKLQATLDSLTYNLITGWVRDIRLQERNSKAVVTGYDGIDWLQRQSCVRGALSTDYPVSSAINDLVQDAGWPYSDTDGWVFPATFNITIGGNNIENNGDTIPYWWAEPRLTIWEELEQIANAFGGDPYVSNDGTFSYNARLYNNVSRLSLTQAEILRDIEQQQPWDELRNSIQVYSYPKAVSSSDSEIWEMNDVILIGASQTATVYAEFTYSNNDAAAIEVNTPSSTDDYLAFDNADGTGTNRTSSISIVMTAYASSAKLEITNNHTSAVYLTLMRLRGVAVYSPTRTIREASDSDSITDYGILSLQIDSPWMQSVAEAQMHASYAKTVFGEDRRVVWARLEGRLVEQLSLDLFDVIELTIDKFTLSGNYFVTYIEHSWKAGDQLRTTFRFEPTPETIVPNLWTFPVVWNENNVTLW